MDLVQTAAFITKRLAKKQPHTFTALWVRINAPRAYHFIKSNIKNEFGDTDWDQVIRSLDRPFQRRWMGESGKRRKKPRPKYQSKEEVDIILQKYRKKLYTFIAPADRADYYLCDIITIALVRIAQKGNTIAKQKVEELVYDIVCGWLERNRRLVRWNANKDKISGQIDRCIRRFRYAGTFLGYLFRTLEQAGMGLPPFYLHSLDVTFPDSDTRKVEMVYRDSTTNEIRYFKSRK